MTRCIYLYDGLGSASQLVNGDGEVWNKFMYEPFGEPKAAGKLLLNRHKEELLHVPFGFTGEAHDFYSGLIYLRARHYDPGVGSFVSRDSYLGNLLRPLSQNRYTYVENNPINYIDPSGHMPVYAIRGVSDLYNRGVLNASLVSAFTLVANGLGTYTAFHEIAQLNIARKLNEMGYSSTLEYSITSKTEMNCWGNDKKYEADIVSGNMVWGVKPIGIDGTTQLQKYMTEGNLIAGFTMDPITDIPVFGDFKMGIVFDRPGIANYYFYKTTKNGEIVFVPAVELKKEYNKRAAGAAVVFGVIMAATLIEDFGTAGAGVADDIPSLIGALKAVGAILAH